MKEADTLKLTEEFLSFVAGADRGLRMRLNIEQYEYMVGPNPGAGIKLLIHENTEVPLVRDLGNAIPPGTHAYVGIQIVQVSIQRKTLLKRKCNCVFLLILHQNDKHYNTRTKSVEVFLTLVTNLNSFGTKIFFCLPFWFLSCFAHSQIPNFNKLQIFITNNLFQLR